MIDKINKTILMTCLVFTISNRTVNEKRIETSKECMHEQEQYSMLPPFITTTKEKTEDITMKEGETLSISHFEDSKNCDYSWECYTLNDQGEQEKEIRIASINLSGDVEDDLYNVNFKNTNKTNCNLSVLTLNRNLSKNNVKITQTLYENDVISIISGEDDKDVKIKALKPGKAKLVGIASWITMDSSQFFRMNKNYSRRYHKVESYHTFEITVEAESSVTLKDIEKMKPDDLEKNTAIVRVENDTSIYYLASTYSTPNNSTGFSMYTLDNTTHHYIYVVIPNDAKVGSTFGIRNGSVPLMMFIYDDDYIDLKNDTFSTLGMYDDTNNKMTLTAKDEKKNHFEGSFSGIATDSNGNSHKYYGLFNVTENEFIDEAREIYNSGKQENNSTSLHNTHNDYDLTDDCPTCGGLGECPNCFGDGELRCDKCISGKCINCSGKGYVKYYSFATHKNEKRDCTYCQNGKCSKCNGHKVYDCPKCSYGECPTCGRKG